MKKKGTLISVLFAFTVMLLALTAIPAMAATHSTVYSGQNYSRVYDYTWYTTNVHPELAGKSDTAVIKYFVTKGIPNKEQGNAAFNVTWYYNQKPGLRYSYGTKWKKYYLYYQKKGYTSGAVSKCTSLQNPITYYKKNGKKIDLSKIYNFKYFTRHYSPAYKYWENQDDAGAVKYFVKTAMKAGIRGNAKYKATSSTYKKYVKKFYSDYKTYTFYAAQKYSSNTKYLIMLNQKSHVVTVLKGKKGKWVIQKQFICAVGKSSTPTVTGQYTTIEKGLYFWTGSDRCWYYTRFHNGYMFHSVIYDGSSSPSRVVDGSLGVNVSHGCVRLALSNAKWIYNNVPLGTKVVSYNSPFA